MPKPDGLETPQLGTFAAFRPSPEISHSINDPDKGVQATLVFTGFSQLLSTGAVANLRSRLRGRTEIS